VQSQLLSDGSDLPVFGIKVAAYLHAGFGTNFNKRSR
jgi:hypothetical protein